MLTGMWFTKKRTGTLNLLPELITCEQVLVLHADGTNECDDQHTCGADELLHDWAVPCHELGCACTGEEHDLVVGRAIAA